MKRDLSRKAYSLIELIISLALVSVVILGIYSINAVLNNSSQDYGQRYLVRSSTQATLNHILNNASLAVGSGTSDAYGNLDLGILYGAGNPPGVGDANSFCIHQAAGNNAMGTSSALWLCYTWYPSSNANYPYRIYYCTNTYSAATSYPSYRGAAACTSSSSNFTFLGSAFSVTPSFNQTTSGFSVTIQNCLNDAASTCNAGSPSGTSSDPVNNPEVQISGSVFPPQQGND